MARVDPLFTSGRPRIAPTTTIRVGRRTALEEVEGRPPTFMERLSSRIPIISRLMRTPMPIVAVSTGRPATPYSSVYPASSMESSVPVAEVQFVNTAEAIDQSEYLLSLLNRLHSTRIPFSPTFWRIVEETFDTRNQSNLEIINNIFRLTQLRGDLFREQNGEVIAPNSLLQFPLDFQLNVLDFVIRNGIHQPPQIRRDPEEDIEVDALDVFYPAELVNEPDILNLEDYVSSDEEGRGLRRMKRRRQKSRRK